MWLMVFSGLFFSPMKVTSLFPSPCYPGFTLSRRFPGGTHACDGAWLPPWAAFASPLLAGGMGEQALPASLLALKGLVFAGGSRRGSG